MQTILPALQPGAGRGSDVLDEQQPAAVDKHPACLPQRGRWIGDGPGGVPTRRAGIVSTIANIGGLTFGPLIAGLLARYEPHALTLPFQVFLVALVPALIGLGLLVASAWTSPPSLALFLIGGVVSGAGGGAIFRGSLTLVISTSDANDRAGVLATFFIAG